MYRQQSQCSNQAFRDYWVTDTVQRLSPLLLGNRVLDVGAGQSPYRGVVESLRLTYLSHDFNAYVPSASAPGLQHETWVYAPHNYVCDILDIPEEAQADLLLCTEVLEHVPDPVATFRHLYSLLRPGGFLLVTVPFLSLMHQAPFWFSSGLSPFWFEHWSKELGIEIDELTVQGDYADLMAQEFSRLLSGKRSGLGSRDLRAFALQLLARRAKASAANLRKKLPTNLLETGGFGTLYVGRKA